MDLGIKGKRAIVLGASKGVGYASALALAAEGVSVSVSGSNLERAQAAAKKITDETGSLAVGFEGDVTNSDNMNALYESSKEALGGPIDILFNNHGGPAFGLAEELDEQELISEFQNMVLSLIRMTSLVLPDMKTSKWGRIITVGSTAIVQPIPNYVLSNTLRGAIVNYMKTLAGEVIADGITVNIVSPSSVLTDRTRQGARVNAEKQGVTPEEILAKREAALPSGRFGTTEEFGGTVAFLCSQYGGYCSGSNWRLDGGLVKSIV
ncbi:MAG: SDR family oxidoreductase [Rhodospirillaceae bacterium]|jgi:3-oxoacyl-[acyl-carrier protein] reductase|nr:SDR family oxidoreductase [Rhodospirillaceae bacterium]MBT7769102.1 SDR family oxidoreductase [Rhodospirillales bacterium]MBT4703270.1 SDR family oxidoreductase [Rhodospirillaceae bacterium]MBT5035095.1 SDR family oxidoreductase [Rhodospirillaceae bacterium]MBT6221103.1 SDR family oxidoreductase [Rhodospirillaceae bacterium]